MDRAATRNPADPQAGAARAATSGMRLDALNLSRSVGEVAILKDVSFTVERGEFVGLLGPSGSGKSTLLKAILGVSPADTGRVLFDGKDLPLARQELARRVGYVPQDDIVHPTLTVGEVLHYAAALRLPADMPEVDVHLRVHRALKSVDLEGREDSIVRDLSGGQRKRVSVAVELLTDPAILFLDEPTSGLDPANEARAMALFRSLADSGRTVVVTTHVVENVDLFDRVALLSRGRLVFFGPPSALFGAFEVSRVLDVYERLKERSPAEWEGEFRAGDLYRAEVSDRARRMPTDAPPSRPTAPGRVQLPTLIARYFLTLVRDRTNLVILLAQAPVIACLIVLACNAGTLIGDRNIIFFMSIAAVWFGCINACREIVKEKPIYDRERMVGLGVLSYAVSKLIVLAVVCAVQTVLLLTVVLAFERLPGNPLGYALLLFLTSGSSLTLGLLVSAVVDSSDRALSMLPIALIPQLIFVSTSGQATEAGRRIETFMISKWGYEGVRHVLERKGVTNEIGMLGVFAVVLFAVTVAALAARDRR